MQSESWHANRHVAENLLRALAAVTPEALKTLQTAELDRIIVLLATTTSACGDERRQR